jgi:hypothetical protein
MRLGSERGEGKLGGYIWLLILLAAGYAAWNVAPAYIDDYALVDKVNEICRTPRGTTTDEKIYEMILREVRERRLDGFLKRNNFKVSTLETSRKIAFSYERELQVLPGWKWMFKRDHEVSQPLIF